MRSYFTMLRRELWCAFTAPQAWTLLAAYLLCSGLLTLTLGCFLEHNSADLNGFFPWQPWLFLFLASALGMGSWSEEYRSGTMELLLAQPVGIPAMAAAKFTAGWLLCAVALALTFPVPATCAWLGDPDWGPIATGYLGCLLAAGLFLAISQAASAFFRSQFVSFAAALLPGTALMLAGFQPFNLLMLKWQLPSALIAKTAHLGLSHRLEFLRQGLLRCEDLLWFLGGIWLFCAIAAWRLRLRHLHRRAAGHWRLLPPMLLVASAFFLHANLDCTHDRLWTLDNGTRQILTDIQEPITIEFHYSEDNFELSAPLRNYAVRIETLLRQMAEAAGCAIQLKTIHPVTDQQQAFSQAAGLEAGATSGGELWFLGARILPRETADGAPGGATTQLIPSFDLKRASQLEYTIARAIAASQRRQMRRIGILSPMGLLEYISPDKKRYREAWWTMQRLAEHFELVEIPENATAIPDGLALVMLVHPKPLSPQLETALKDYNTRRPLLLCVDPLCQSELVGQPKYARLTSSAVPAFLSEATGVTLAKGKVVADRQLAAQMTDATQGLAQVPTLLKCRQPQFTTPSSMTDGLQSILLFCPGYFQIQPRDGVQQTILLSTTGDGALLEKYEAQRTGADILADYRPDAGAPYPLALQVERPDAASVVMVADADWLYDSLCVSRTQEQDGRKREVQLSGNMDLLLNIADAFSDDSRLLRLRTRGLNRRGFRRIEALAAQAETRIQELDTKAWQESCAGRSALLAKLQTLGQTDTGHEETTRLVDDFEAQEALRNRLTKVAQRQVLHGLRLQLNRLERHVAWQMVLAIPLLLILCAAIIGWRRRA